MLKIALHVLLVFLGRPPSPTTPFLYAAFAPPAFVSALLFSKPVAQNAHFQQREYGSQM